MRAELAAKADGFSRRAKKMVERAKAGLVSLDTRWNELTPERRGAIAGALNTALENFQVSRTFRVIL